jgi:hypothetical protein
LQLQIILIRVADRCDQELPMPSQPHSVYRNDALVAELRVAEAFILTLLRLWAAPYRTPRERHPDWRQGFAAAGIGEDGSGAFDALFRIVVSAARRPLDVRCRHCTRLGTDEAWLLQLVMVVQRARRLEAAAILAEWLPPAAVRMAMMPALGFARALAGAGLVVPLRHSEAAEIHRRVPAANVRGCELVH